MQFFLFIFSEEEIIDFFSPNSSPETLHIFSLSNHTSPEHTTVSSFTHSPVPLSASLSVLSFSLVNDVSDVEADVENKSVPSSVLPFSLTSNFENDDEDNGVLCPVCRHRFTNDVLLAMHSLFHTQTEERF